MTNNIKEIMAGNVYDHEPNAISISEVNYMIVTYAVKLEGCRSRGFESEIYQGALLEKIEKMRSQLRLMEKWAKMEKPE